MKDEELKEEDPKDEDLKDEELKDEELKDEEAEVEGIETKDEPEQARDHNEAQAPSSANDDKMSEISAVDLDFDAIIADCKDLAPVENEVQGEWEQHGDEEPEPKVERVHVSRLWPAMKKGGKKKKGGKNRQG